MPTAVGRMSRVTFHMHLTDCGSGIGNPGPALRLRNCKPPGTARCLCGRAGCLRGSTEDHRHAQRAEDITVSSRGCAAGSAWICRPHGGAGQQCHRAYKHALAATEVDPIWLPDINPTRACEVAGPALRSAQRCGLCPSACPMLRAARSSCGLREGVHRAHRFSWRPIWKSLRRRTAPSSARRVVRPDDLSNSSARRSSVAGTRPALARDGARRSRACA